MNMKQNGLAKLIEECGEVLQVAGKMVQYPDLQSDTEVTHPDGTNLRECLQQELADLLASISFVKAKLSLDEKTMVERAMVKLTRYQEWDNEKEEL